MKYGRRLVLSITLISVLLIGPTLAMVDAAILPYATVTHSQSFDRAENNHTYVRVDQATWFANDFLDHEEDISYTSYSISRTGWSSGSESFTGPAEREFSWTTSESASWGWISESIPLPQFYDFTTEHEDSDIGATHFYNVFPMVINEEHTLLMESGYMYIGTFNVTDEEFFHLTVDSHQDGLEMYWMIIDSHGRGITENGLDNGDIEITPFATYGNGTYYLLIMYQSSDPAITPVDLLLEPVVPTTIGIGEMVEGILPGSETYIAEDGSLYYREIPPTAHTYKFSTNSTQYACLQYGINYPGPTMMISYPTHALIMGSLMRDEVIDYPYMWATEFPSDCFFYTSFANESFYITMQGMDNAEYYIINQLVDVPDLPVNQEFFIQNWRAGLVRMPYVLNLGQDSVLRLNRTEWSSGFNWEAWTIKDNGLYDTFSISEAGTFEDASTIYLPAGEYLIIATSQGSDASGLYEFNIGPVLEGAGNVNVPVDRLLGVRVPVENLMFYRSNLTLLNHDNITVSVEVDFLNELGLNEFATSTTLGNRQSGTSWQAFGVNTTSWELGLSGSSYSQFCDGNLIIAISPYAVLNNTGGGGGNELWGRTADFEITFDEDAERILTEEDSVVVGDELTWYNFTLAELGDATERYALRITMPAGVWVNVSIYGEDMDDLDIYVYQDIDGCPIYAPWATLDNTLVGTIHTEGAFQFGSVSDEILMIFDVSRLLVEEGSLDIGITPFLTNAFEWLPTPDYYNYGDTPGPVPVGMDPGLAIGVVAVVGIVVVVVVVVLLKKQGKI